MLRRMEVRTDTAPPLAYSLDHAAALIDLSRRSLYRLIDRGELRTVKVGRRRLVPTMELERLMRAGHSATESAE